VRFNVWLENDYFELHFYHKDTLIFDGLYLKNLIQVVNEITGTISKFEG
jgi:hypothetical protein